MDYRRDAMKKLSLCLCALILAANVVAEESAGDRLADVRSELDDALAAATAAPETIDLRAKAEEARKALEEAEKQTPGVPEIDAKMAETRKTLRALQRDRNVKLRANAEKLDAMRAELEEAERAYGKACRGGEKGMALLLKRNALLRQLDPPPRTREELRN